MIRAGTFREDLYYRLNVIEIALPPLAERADDILPLAEHFLGRRQDAGDATRATALLRHAWPGNVRELKNAIQRAALLATGAEITAADLGLPDGRAARSRATERARPRSDRGRAGAAPAAWSRRPRRARLVAPGAVPAHGALGIAARLTRRS